MGQVPVMVIFVPATKPGVAVPVPPLATGKMPVASAVAKSAALLTAKAPRPRFVRAAPAFAPPVPPLATGKTPETPDVSGNPVAFVSVADAGVPRFGVVSVAPAARTTFPVPVDEIPPNAPPLLYWICPLVPPGVPPPPPPPPVAGSSSQVLLVTSKAQAVTVLAARLVGAPPMLCPGCKVIVSAVTI